MANTIPLQEHAEVNCGPLCNTSCFGDPYLVNMVHSASSVFSIEVVVMGTTLERMWKDNMEHSCRLSMVHQVNSTDVMW